MYYGLPNTYFTSSHVHTCVLRMMKGNLTMSSSWHQVTQQLFDHQSFVFNLHSFDVIIWHPRIAAAAQLCESEPEINSRSMSGRCEYLSLTGESELSSSPWNFWSIPPIYFTATVGPERTLISVCFQRAAVLLPAVPRPGKVQKSHPWISGAPANAYYSG